MSSFIGLLHWIASQSRQCKEGAGKKSRKKTGYEILHKLILTFGHIWLMENRNPRIRFVFIISLIVADISMISWFFDLNCIIDWRLDATSVQKITIVAILCRIETIFIKRLWLKHGLKWNHPKLHHRMKNASNANVKWADSHFWINYPH